MRFILLLLVCMSILPGCGGGVNAPTGIGIAPRATTLSRGDTVRFTATLPEPDSSDSSSKYHWFGGGGGFLSVSSDGRTADYTAGSVAGAYEVGFTHEDYPGQVAAAVVTVTLPF